MGSGRWRGRRWRCQAQNGRATRRTRLLALEPGAETALVEDVVAGQLLDLLGGCALVVGRVRHLLAANDADGVGEGGELLRRDVRIHDVEVLDGAA